ncbi:hypothetical protein GLOIN_2v1881587 [Rhizophagus irregularis DAOM 181602=DAOM 197198]|nr:hypothetical protein GLOIN_2v1881587 [Rhizophagus irregularis DAOM 181602=DAOM 197198]
MMVEGFCAQTRWSKLTDKILISLWNAVMIPAIEYHLQAVVLMERECENILAKVNKIFKHSCNLAIGCPNAIIYDKDILKIFGGLYELVDIFSEKVYNKWKMQLMNKKILFLDQIIEHDKEYLMKWHHFCVENGFNKCGGEPLWYKRLKQLVCIEETREIKDKYKINKAEQKSIDYFKKNDTSKEFNSIGIHYMMEDSEVYDDNDSPWLKKCTGCSKNISRNKDDDICLLHCNIGDGLSREIKINNILINNKDKEVNEVKRTGMEDIEETDFFDMVRLYLREKTNLGSVEIKLMTRYKKIEKIFLKFSIEKGMNEIKRMLITLIIVSGLFPDNKKIIIEINKKFFVELENFRDEMSNRKKLDFKNYVLLFQIFTEKSLRVSFSYDILEEMSEFDVKIETMKKDLMDNTSSMLDVRIIY